MITEKLSLKRMEEYCEKATKRCAIPSCPGYEADETGAIWSVSQNWRGYGTRQLAPIIDRYGYAKVRVVIRGKRTKRSVHQLILESLVGPRPNGFQIRHINGNKLDNRLENLAYGTHQENMADKIRLGEAARGSRNGASKLLEHQVSEIRELLRAGQSERHVAKLYRVSSKTIGDIRKGKTWKYLLEELGE